MKTKTPTAKQVLKIIQDTVVGVWEPRHNDYGHRYINTITGVMQKSVTTKQGGVLSKPHLMAWSVKMGALWLLKEDRINRIQTERFRDDMIKGMQIAHTDIRDDAGAVGTIAHDAAEAYILEWLRTKKKPKDITSFAPEGADPRSIASMRAVEAFFNKHTVIPLASEILVGDDRYSAGTLDFLCMMNGKLTLVDFKTSNAIDQIGYSTQIAAYKYFFEKMTGLKIKDCKILHLSKDSDKFTVYKVNRIAHAWKAFKMICQLYDWVYGVRDKIVKDIKRIKI